jgi:hypothetical protein
VTRPETFNALTEAHCRLVNDLGRATVRQARRDSGQDARLADLERMLVAVVERLVAIEKGGER